MQDLGGRYPPSTGTSSVRRRRCKRAAWIQLPAAQLTCYVLILVLVAGSVGCLITGSDALTIWSRLSALAGLTYLAGMVWLRRSS